MFTPIHSFASICIDDEKFNQESVRKKRDFAITLFQRRYGVGCLREYDPNLGI